MERRVNEEGDITFVSPTIKLETSDGMVELDYFNCRIRKFGEAVFNYLEYDDGHEKIHIEPDEGLLEDLERLSFPSQYDPYPDSDSFEEKWQIDRNNLLEDLEAL